MRPEVEIFVAAGRLPDSEAAVDEIAAREDQLHAILPPVSEAEARAMSACFGSDDCYGLAWTLIHLIETCRVDIVASAPDESAQEWLYLLWHRQRMHRRQGN